jgi:hypothetical protein
MENVVYNVMFTWFEWCGVGIIGLGALYCLIMELRGRMRTYVYGIMILILVSTVLGSIMLTFNNKMKVIRAFHTGTVIIDRNTGKECDSNEYARLYNKYFNEVSD